MKIATTAAIGLTLALWPHTASAKLACYLLSDIERALDAEYGEVRHFAGTEGTGVEYRLYINSRTGSWSWVGVPAGAKVGCLIFAGRGGDALPALKSLAPASPPEVQF